MPSERWEELAIFAYGSWCKHGPGTVVLEEPLRYVDFEQLCVEVKHERIREGARRFIDTYNPEKQFVVLTPDPERVSLLGGTSARVPRTLYELSLMKRGGPDYITMAFRHKRKRR